MSSDGSTQIVPDIKNAAVITAAGMMIEPYGEHSFSELKGYYAECVAKAPDASAFLLKNMSLMSDLRAAVLACRKSGKPVFAELKIDGELMTSGDMPADAALITLQCMGLSGFGIAADDDETVIDALCRLVHFSKIPLFGSVPKSKAAVLTEAGINVTFCEDIAFCSIPEEEKETALLLANERQAFFLEHDTTEISDEIICEGDIDEILSDASDESFDVLKIRLDSPDDAVAFSMAAHMATLPIMFSSEDDITVKLALMLYQGRALIDSECMLSEDTLVKAVQKYGAIIY